jgi:hypothetical protein
MTKLNPYDKHTKMFTILEQSHKGYTDTNYH